jgi:hypothetical protein
MQSNQQPDLTLQLLKDFTDPVLPPSCGRQRAGSISREVLGCMACQRDSTGLALHTLPHG